MAQKTAQMTFFFSFLFLWRSKKRISKKRNKLGGHDGGRGGGQGRWRSRLGLYVKRVKRGDGKKRLRAQQIFKREGRRGYFLEQTIGGRNEAHGAARNVGSAK